jgi:hypothetical protein
MRRVVLVDLLVGVGALTVLALPDIRRYSRISRM